MLEDMSFDLSAINFSLPEIDWSAFDPSLVLPFVETPTGALAAGVIVLTLVIGVMLIRQSTRALKFERDSSSAGFDTRAISELRSYKGIEHTELSTLLFPKTYTPAHQPRLNGPDTR